MVNAKITLRREIATVDKLPNECPRCHIAIHVADDAKMGENTRLNRAFEVVFQCPSCLRLFICTYGQKPTSNGIIYMLETSQPFFPKKLDIDDHIKEISTDFGEIYNQAHIAEQSSLSQIAGLGYRKALEFLVKDFCIYQSPAEADLIKSSRLMSCINKLNNIKIKQAAERAAWLGNDETHYVRKFENKDISDLKNLLKIVETHVVQEIMLKKYSEEMQKK